ENASQPFNASGAELVDQAIQKKEQMLRKVRELHEVNPMLGHRGVRLGITYPEIYKMQIQAILEATADCEQKGVKVHPEIMVPQVVEVEELKLIAGFVQEANEKLEQERNIKLTFKFGTMVEAVRACLQAEELAATADFFSF